MNKKTCFVNFFKSPAAVSKYITTHKIQKRNILSLFYNGESYALFYFSKLRKEIKFKEMDKK